MIEVTLTNYKLDKSLSLECKFLEIEKGYYKFYVDDFSIKYISSYDWVLDAKYPFEQRIEKAKK